MQITSKFSCRIQAWVFGPCIIVGGSAGASERVMSSSNWARGGVVIYTFHEFTEPMFHISIHAPLSRSSKYSTWGLLKERGS
jgi:hypothetical protein